MTAALWAYALAGTAYAAVTHRHSMRRSSRYREACRRNPSGAALAVLVIAATWWVLVADDLLRWARRCRACAHRRRLLRKIRTQSVCTVRADRPTV